MTCLRLLDGRRETQRHPARIYPATVADVRRILRAERFSDRVRLNRRPH